MYIQKNFYNKIFPPIHLHDPNNFYTRSVKRNIWYDNMEGEFIFSYVNIGTIQKINFIYTSDILLQNDSNILEAYYPKNKINYHIEQSKLEQGRMIDIVKIIKTKYKYK